MCMLDIEDLLWVGRYGSILMVIQIGINIAINWTNIFFCNTWHKTIYDTQIYILIHTKWCWWPKSFLTVENHSWKQWSQIFSVYCMAKYGYIPNRHESLIIIYSYLFGYNYIWHKVQWAAIYVTVSISVNLIDSLIFCVSNVWMGKQSTYLTSIWESAT